MDVSAGSVLGLCLINEPWTTAVGGPIQLQTVKDWAQTAVGTHLKALDHNTPEYPNPHSAPRIKLVRTPVLLLLTPPFSLVPSTDAVLAAGWKGHIWYPDGFAMGWEGWQGFLPPPQYQVSLLEPRRTQIAM